MSVITGELPKILIITNQIKIRNHLEHLLAQFYQLSLANSELIGLEIIKSTLPDLIILALTEPELNRIYLFSELLKNPATAVIPVIYLTSHNEFRQWRVAMEMGADDVLLFPCTASELLNAIAVRLSKQTAFLTYKQQEIERLRESIIKFLPHEMRTALTGILAASELLNNQIHCLNWSIIIEMLNCINSSSQRLLRLVDNFLLYAELKSLENSPQTIQVYRSHQVNSVEEKIKAIANYSAQKYFRQDSLILNLQDANLQISENNLSKLIEEIIDNACKFSPPQTPIEISSQICDERFILTIKDSSRGMTHQQIASIEMGIQFERDYYEQQGFGLGLAISKQITKIYGCKLEIKSVPTQTTIVSLSIPLASRQTNLVPSNITSTYNYSSPTKTPINYSI